MVLPGPNPEVTLAYRFRRTRFPGRGWTLVFQTDPPGVPIPASVLVVHPRTVPLAVDDGQIAASFPPARDGATFPIDPAIDLQHDRARVFTDPRVEPDGLPPIRLRHPETDATRV